jgi:Cdc6-like AAA superfamily ATPase
MEPLIAIGLAANILQFIHTAKQLVSTGREIFDAGTKNEYLELELISKDLRSRADRLILPAVIQTAPKSENENTVEGLAFTCNEIADELLSTLDKIKLDSDRNRWSSFLQALKTQWHDDQIEALRRRLDRVGQAVNSRLADEKNLGVQSRLDELLASNYRLEISRTEDIVGLRKEFHQVLERSQRRTREDDLVEDISKAGEDDLVEKISKVALDGLHYSAEQKILSRLRFIRLEDRYRLISVAHRNTLIWLFGDTALQGQYQVSESSTFVQWLQSDNDLYWISGRPGSGKSTLMKFLCDHEKTKEHLRRWAASHEVIIAEYFFWNAGKNDLQKSQEGLLRSLLYQIFRKCPDYISVVFPGVWRCYNSTDTVYAGHVDRTTDTEMPHNVPDLMEALRRTVNLLTQSERRLCLFIDGLDEYVGDSSDVIKLVGVLRTLKHVKICVSSRPWNEFEEAFGKNRTDKLYMQDFNHQDINTYIEDEFANDDNYQELEDVETLGKSLVEDIVTAANGVFLWVVLVVSSLKDGLREADSVARLQKRLRELPTNLEELFERIIFRDVRPSYRDQASHMFLVALEAKENLPLMAYWFLGEDLPQECLPLRIQQTIKRHKDAEKRLIASCKGLLEPRYHSKSKEQDSLPAAMLFEYTVDFLHRTVRDYLLLPMTNIRQWAAPDFSPDEAICKALYSQIKTAPHEKEYGPHALALYETYQYHANATRRWQKADAEISVLSAELVSIVSKFGISDFTNVPNVVAKPTADAETNNARQPESVVTDLLNINSGPKVRKHRARRLASRLGIGKKSTEGPAVDKV